MYRVLSDPRLAHSAPGNSMSGSVISPTSIELSGGGKTPRRHSVGDQTNLRNGAIGLIVDRGSAPGTWSNFCSWHSPAVLACPRSFPLLEVNRQCCREADRSQFERNRTCVGPISISLMKRCQCRDFARSAIPMRPPQCSTSRRRERAADRATNGATDKRGARTSLRSPTAPPRHQD